MNLSPFMDKQITRVAASPGAGSTSTELLNPMNPQEERRDNGGVLRMEEILPSYDFQPIRQPPSLRTCSDVDAVTHSRLSSSNLFGDMSSYHETKLGHRNGPLIEDMESTMKKYADILLHAVEGMSSRLLKLESRACIVENSVDDLRVSIEDKYGSTDGMLKHLENILREVQTAVQLLRDKQDIADAHLQHSRLQISEADHKDSKNSQRIPDSQQQLTPQPLLQQSIQQAPQPTAMPLSQPTPSPLPPNAAPPPPPPQQNPPVQFPQPNPPVHFPSHLPERYQFPSVPSLPRHSYPIPSNQVPQYTPPAGQPADSTPPQQQQYQMQAPQPPQHQYSQPLQPEDAKSYMPLSQPYPTNTHRPTLPFQPPTRPSPQHHLGASPAMYELPGSMSFPSSYGGTGFSEPSPYNGSPSHYNMKQSPFTSSPPTSDGSSGYQHHLPMAKILSQAAPAGSSSSSGDVGPTGNRVPIDDVIDRVTTMGFSRDQVRATVRKLTENGQSVDLNVVLDKLMNSGELPQKGRFRR